MENKDRVIKLNCKDYQETTAIGDGVYSTMDLYNRAKDEETLLVPISALELSVTPWGSIENIYQFCQHYARCEDSDLDYPILLDPTGGILNGWHRICKAIIKGDKYIKAQRLSNLPEPIITNKD